jgi:hypothetical protein
MKTDKVKIVIVENDAFYGESSENMSIRWLIVQFPKKMCLLCTILPQRIQFLAAQY